MRATELSPQNLSERAFIVGVGVATRQYRGAMGWFEAGTAFSYIDGQRWKDYRGGVSFARVARRVAARRPRRHVL